MPPAAATAAPGLAAGALMCVVGARPNFMKAAPLLAALRRPPAVAFPTVLVHTGQHHGADMQEAFFRQLGLPRPDLDLEVGSAPAAVQTAEIMRRFDAVLEQAPPAAVLVVGDVTSTLACSLAAAKRGVPVVHVEAGLRSGDRAMPEEINRIVTDQLASLHLTTERGARDNLVREGIDPAGIRFVGNLMVDSLRAHAAEAVPVAATLERYAPGAGEGVAAGELALVTMHRPSNVDDPAVLEGLVAALEAVSERLPVVFPVHPRTRAALDRLRWPRGRARPLLTLPPVGYLEMLGLLRGARVVLTDSGGMQEETTAEGIPCLTLRANTERPVTLEQGTNRLVGSDPERILAAVDDILTNGGRAGRIPELWDGHAADRIREVLSQWTPLCTTRTATRA
ncbi:MAG TPA: UDP-N-acetylglucosamine 2-epimerase (non-hydrolyzing) [Gammaproteobacteria bacterium]|nr:UDP-N-acetylglucosamine 2-epimerase (non-hydrolyzing) [Gammaproteobacteria bacterium]